MSIDPIEIVALLAIGKRSENFKKPAQIGTITAN